MEEVHIDIAVLKTEMKDVKDDLAEFRADIKSLKKTSETILQTLKRAEGDRDMLWGILVSTGVAGAAVMYALQAAFGH